MWLVFTNEVTIEPIYFTSVFLWLRSRHVFFTVSLIIYQLKEETLAEGRVQDRKSLNHGRLPMEACIGLCHGWAMSAV